MKLKSGTDSFGIMIAFMVPGFVALWGASYHSTAISEWLQAGEEGAPTVGGFLYATLGSIAAGVAVSGFRWFLIDVIWCWVFGAKKDDFKFKNLPGREDAFGFVHENHYRYYLYYANMLIASFITYGSRFFARYFEKLDLWNKRECFFLIVFLILEFILGIGAWDTRRKYYERGKAILSD